MNWTDFAVGLVTSLVGSFGFALIFRLRPRYLIPASLGGLLAFAVYFVGDFFGLNLFLSNLLAAAVGALYSESLARLMKSPSVTFMIPCLIPLVPGSSLYYSMSALLKASYDESFARLVDTLMTALGIAAGMVVVSVMASILGGIAKARQEKKQ